MLPLWIRLPNQSTTLDPVPPSNPIFHCLYSLSSPGQMKIEDSCLTCDKISNALFCIYSLHSIQVICQASFITTDLLNTIQ